MARVRIPTPLLSYTGGDAVVEVDGATVLEVLHALDERFPGIKFRMVDEQGRVRPHMKIFVGDLETRDLNVTVNPEVEVTIMQALSGG